MVLGDGFLSFTCPPPLDVVVWAPPPLALGLIVQSNANRAQLNTICVLILIYADLIINNIAARVSRININNTDVRFNNVYITSISFYTTSS